MIFMYWLSKQNQRDDPIGDLARDVQRDTRELRRYFANRQFDERGHANLSLKDMYRYIRAHYGCLEALEALVDAFREWQGLGNTYRVRCPAGGLKLRFVIMQRDGFRCCLCGRSAQNGAILEIDHKIARARGGTDDEANLWTLCFECNRGKRDRLL